MANKAISFNSNSLQTSNIVTNSIKHIGGPDVDALTSVLANANKSTIDGIYYPSKVITIGGSIIGSSVSDCETKVDTFKSYLAGKVNKNLDIGYGSGTRRYIVTPTKVSDLDQIGEVNHVEFTVEFTCSQPFGKATSESTILSDTGRTNSNYSDNYTFAGTAPIQLPVITITLNSVTDGDNNYITIGNNATGQQLIINRTFADDDVIEIDCYNKTVKVNNSEVDFTGSFPEFETGSQYLDYADGFTDRDFDIEAVYVPLYM